MSPEPRLHPRRGHAPVGQVGPRLHRVRRGRRARRARRRRPRLAPDPARRRRRHHPQRLPRLRRRRDVRPDARLERRARVSSSYAACASGSQALQSARAQILAGFCDVALVIGADTTPKGFFAPVGGERRNDPDWLRFRLLGATNPVYFALYARRRMDLYGATLEDFAAGEGEERPARPGEPERPLPQGDLGRGRAGQPGGLRPAAAARHLRDLRRRGGADRGQHGRSPRSTSARSTACRRCARSSTVTPRYPQHLPELPDIATDSTAVVPAPERVFKDQILDAAYEEAGIGPEDLEPGRGLRPVHRARARLVRAHRPVRRRARPSSCCAAARRPSAAASRSTRPAGWPASARPSPRRPSPRSASSPGSCRARPTGRQVEGATVGVTANQGLFGHGSSVIVAR